jgi:hypothetical protein
MGVNEVGLILWGWGPMRVLWKEENKIALKLLIR